MKIKIYFWIRRSKATDGLGAINCRIFVDGGKANDFSTGIKIPADKWDKQRQTVKGRHHQAESDRLNMIREELTAMANDMRRDGAALTAKLLHAAYIGGKAEKTGLREYLWIFFEGAKTRIAPGTLRAYRGRIRNLDAYLEANGCCFAGLGQKTADGMEKWFGAKGYKVSHTAKHISLLKTIVKQAIRDEIIAQSPFLYAGYAKPATVTPLFLMPEELAAIAKTVFASAPLQRVADLFVFQAWTGMAYDDLSRFDAAKNLKTMSGRMWVVYERGKTDGGALAPFFPLAASILAKYPEGLPVITNQKYNAYLKEVGAIVGIETKLTTHLARKTFGAVMLNEGFSMESVSKMLGHKTIYTTQRFYARVGAKRIADEMDRLGM